MKVLELCSAHRCAEAVLEAPGSLLTTDSAPRPGESAQRPEAGERVQPRNPWNQASSDCEDGLLWEPWDGEESCRGLKQVIDASDHSTQSAELSKQKNKLLTVVVVEQS